MLKYIMSSADFQKVLVKDDRLSNITDSIKYAVIKGAQSFTPAQFNAISQSTSSHTYNIQVPSQETVIDRRVMWKSTVSFNVVVRTSNAGPNAMQLTSNTDYRPLGYGGVNSLAVNGVNYVPYSSSLSPFPLHNLCSVITSTINNTSVSINMQDVLPFLLRFYDKKELAKLNSTCPAQYDIGGNYAQMVSTLFDSNAGFQESMMEFLPRGSWKLDSVVNDLVGPAYVMADGSDTTFTVTFTSIEPLLLSPWMFNDPSHSNGGIYGIQNLNFVMNIGSANRLWRTSMPPLVVGPLAPGFYLKSVSLVSFSSSELQFNFLTGHPSDLMPSRNVSPYYEVPRFITNLGAFASASTVEFTSQSLQLNQIPDKLIVAVRKTLGQQNSNDADCWFPISKVNIQFNNQAGLLSSATKTDLFRMTHDAGYNGSYYEFDGIANQPNNDNTILSGGFLILDFATAIQLPEDFYSCGSLGNFNLQVKCTATNRTAVNYASGECELVIITLNSGVFVSERGTSQVFTGILTKQDVLDASSQVAVSKGSVRRLVGGSFWDTLKSWVSPVLSTAKTLAPVAKAALNAMSDPRAKTAASVIGALGYGPSGGSVSGGRKKMMDERLM